MAKKESEKYPGGKEKQRQDKEIWKRIYGEFLSPFPDDVGRQNFMGINSLSHDIYAYENPNELSRKDYLKAADHYEFLARNYKKEGKKEDATRCFKIARELKHRKRPLEKSIEGMVGIISIIVGIFFLSPNLTGNAIANLTNQTSNIIGGALFVIGIIGGYFWFKKKRG